MDDVFSYKMICPFDGRSCSGRFQKRRFLQDSSFSQESSYLSRNGRLLSEKTILKSRPPDQVPSSSRRNRYNFNEKIEVSSSRTRVVRNDPNGLFFRKGLNLSYVLSHKNRPNGSNLFERTENEIQKFLFSKFLPFECFLEVSVSNKPIFFQSPLEGSQLLYITTPWSYLIILHNKSVEFQMIASSSCSQV